MWMVPTAEDHCATAAAESVHMSREITLTIFPIWILMKECSKDVGVF